MIVITTRSSINVKPGTKCRHVDLNRNGLGYKPSNINYFLIDWGRSKTRLHQVPSVATVLPNWGKYIRRNSKFHYQRLHSRLSTDAMIITLVTSSDTSNTTADANGNRHA